MTLTSIKSQVTQNPIAIKYRLLLGRLWLENSSVNIQLCSAWPGVLQLGPILLEKQREKETWHRI